jgi:hypothetical protein
LNPYAPPGIPPTASQSRRAAVPIAGLEGRVFVRERTFFGGPGFVVDGVYRPTVRGTLEVTDAAGRVHRLRLRGFPLDPCPRVEVDGAVVDAFPRLPVWASILCAVPVLLVALGGLVGGILGICVVYSNFRIARASMPAAARVLCAMLLTLGALAASLAMAMWIRSLGRS